MIYLRLYLYDFGCVLSLDLYWFYFESNNIKLVHLVCINLGPKPIESGLVLDLCVGLKLNELGCV